MEDKIGVYVCRCGTNIAEKIDVDAVVKHFEGIGGSVVVGEHNLICSEEGKAFLEEEIKKKKLKRLVLGACSPRQHEHTFRAVCEKSGINPFLMQMANIRELSAWSTDDPGAATEKAKAMINAALQRAKLQEPLEKREIEVSPDALVVGAGVAGMSAALLLAQKGRKVTLVEKNPCIGGMAVRYEDVFPNLDCAPCMLEPVMDDILHHDNIELLTNSEVEEVTGFLGNFTVKIKKKARYVVADACFGCDACYEPCPVSVPNEFNEGLNERKAIYTPFPGALPNVPVIDTANCVRFKGEECTKCAESCGFGAINYDDKDEVIERAVGGVVLATGFNLLDCSGLDQYGYSKYDNVVTSLELERIISTTGPTEGKVEVGGKTPKKAAIIHCVGGRSESTRNYCSSTCCQNSLKLSHLLKKNVEGIEVQHIYSDWCLPGKEAQRFFDKVSGEGAKFARVDSTENLKVAGKKGALTITSGKNKHGPFDLVVLAPAIVPGADTAKLAGMFSVDLDRDGFYTEAHNRINPAATNTEGVFVCGCAQGPKDIQGSVVQGQASAGGILSALVPGQKLELEAATAEIDEELCSGCQVCNSLCPYKAISHDEEKKVSWINEVLCKGCGTCGAACPSGAIKSKHFTKQQIEAEIAGVLA
ncbi:MAG: CoB--CoM heterodisulfide reductase iron-sulfur subunit A family protein [bacterium]